MDEKLPPYLPEDEEGALACALVDPNHIPSLKFEWFYLLRSQALASALIGMYARGEATNLVTVPHYLKSIGKLESAGGLELIASLPDKSPSSANFRYYAEALEKVTLRRKQASVASRMREGAYNDLIDPYGAQAEYEAALMEISRGSQKGEKTNAEVLREIGDDIEHAQQHIGEVIGLPTGIRALDRVLGGMREGQVIVTAARPGFGKSSLLANIATHLAVNCGTPVAILSLEMARKQILERMACGLARLDSRAKQDRELKEPERQRLIVAFSKLAKAPIHIIDQDVDTMPQIASKARQLISQHGVKLIGIDYLGLIKGANPKASLYQKITEASNDVKLMAKALNITVLLAAQLNRDHEKDGRPPIMADLRDSGAIEADADAIIMIHHHTELERDGIVPCDLLVPKGRNGPTGKASVTYNKPTTTFHDVSPI